MCDPVPDSDGPHRESSGDKHKIHELATKETETHNRQHAQGNTGQKAVHRANRASHRPHLVNIYRFTYSGHVTELYAIPP